MVNQSAAALAVLSLVINSITSTECSICPAAVRSHNSHLGYLVLTGRQHGFTHGQQHSSDVHPKATMTSCGLLHTPFNNQ
jgi:hypothetical protein